MRLPAEVARAVREHLSRAYPEEGCGVLLGRESEVGREVVRAIMISNRNRDSRGNRYLIAPEEFLRAERQGREAGLDVVGFYHSHPDHPALPSAFDLEHAWPYYCYVIVSVERGAAGGLTSWRLRDDRSRFDSEPVELLQRPSPDDRDDPGEPR
ncbi:MAG: hypothetical protein A2W00_12145 [Candidatus Eisenbacteria bacterium RBG_16_71_46]|nr:MAG: hypothetical protein A2W00_12145 [Candidatus Eisenbacteria bacterium RBG_16_71_46]OGF23967.1 MAG: hypothetical protein A2V63_04805 [Candidatus Eisenbacteria bacterium RBG_19FT_COMBO_70_11]